MTVTDHAADAARSAAVILAHDLGHGLPTEVEAALAAANHCEYRPGQYDLLAIAGFATGAAGLIVSIAQLAWSVYTDLRKHTSQPSPESIARQIRVIMREQDMALPPDAGRIAEVVVTEIIRRAPG